MATLTIATTGRILEGLSPAQQEAVLHGEGPLIIIAGAGTGKTTVLTRRIAHLIASKQARPEEILALTFTEKAAAEMAERVDQLIPYGYAETWIGTFHAFGDRVLRENALDTGLEPAFRVLTRPEQVIFLRERLWRLPLRRFRPLGDPTRHLDALLTLVSRAKDEDISPAAYVAWAGAQPAAAESASDPPAARDRAEKHRELAAFYEAYQGLLAEAGAVDFGDQIFRALELMRARPAVRAALRERYRYILVDEFQDTNHAQLELVRLLAAGPSPNVTVVGDDDQAIYRWRGAAAANLLAFRELYPQARQVVLTDNHRSTQVILDAATRLVSYNNPWRLEAMAGLDKRLRSGRPTGEPVRHLRFDTVSAEADGVAAEVEGRLAAGFRPRDVALLVRSNDDADPFLRALNVRGIPHRFTGSRGLYAREEVRLLVAFLRALAHPDDSVSVFYLAASEVYAMPAPELLRLNRYAQRKTRPLLDVLRGLAGNEELAGVGAGAREAAARLVSDLDRAAGDVPRMRTGEVLYRFLQSSGLLARLSREASARSEAAVKNIARFFDVVKGYGDVAEHDRVPAFVLHLDLLREAGDDPAVAEAEPDEDAVAVLTVHKAKGLEFPVVFIVGAAEEKFPVKRRGEPLELPGELVKGAPGGGDAHLMEERRLFYVAMTRAREELLLTSAADHGTARPRKVSRFVVEALDLPSPAPPPRKSQALETLARHQGSPEPPTAVEAPLAAGDPLTLSFRQIDDYQTCPLKYHYIHRLRVPLLAHHRVVFGSAVHKAVQEHFRARLEGRTFSEDDLVAAFRAAWVSEGFLSRQHEEERLRAGEEMLRRFHREESSQPLRPTAVEREFAFVVEQGGAGSRPSPARRPGALGPSAIHSRERKDGALAPGRGRSNDDAPLALAEVNSARALPRARTKVVGRYDLVVEADGEVTILDFKTGAVDDEKKARERARESLQLDLYALAWLRTHGRMPDRLELRFLESGLVAGKRPALEQARATEEAIRAVAERVRRREFPPTPSYMACGQCAFRDICPHTARGPEDGP